MCYLYTMKNIIHKALVTGTVALAMSCCTKQPIVEPAEADKRVPIGYILGVSGESWIDSVYPIRITLNGMELRQTEKRHIPYTDDLFAPPSERPNWLYHGDTLRAEFGPSMYDITNQLDTQTFRIWTTWSMMYVHCVSAGTGAEGPESFLIKRFDYADTIPGTQEFIVP